MKRLLVALVLLMPIAACQAQGTEPYRAGVHYDLIDPPQSSSGDGIEIVEIFSYVCPHCYSFQPHVAAWEKNQPADTRYVRMPALLGRRAWVPYARAYYTAEVMGILDQTHEELFKALHVERNPLRTDADMAGFFEEYGVNGEDYLHTSESFAVVTKMQRAQKLERDFGVRGTPTLVVAGKYRISANAAVQPNTMFDVVNFLVAKEMATTAVEGDDSSATEQQDSD